MTNRLAAALAAGALTIGILVGAAGTVLVHDATRPAMGMGGMTQMMEMMGGGMGGGMMSGGMISPEEHESHHRGDR